MSQRSDESVSKVFVSGSWMSMISFIPFISTRISRQSESRGDELIDTLNRDYYLCVSDVPLILVIYTSL